MGVAYMNMVPSIDGDRGDTCACATRHVFVESWLARLPTMEQLEVSMLDLTTGVCLPSRLARQIKSTANLDDIVLLTPVGQH